ncbi:MAG: hypothetical protein D3910_22530 [Candidatus Electrothrix sp. ATG2]|nr:hypothetical protein [Candidatus Electrothrix sp. ATG2]
MYRGENTTDGLSPENYLLFQEITTFITTQSNHYTYCPETELPFKDIYVILIKKILLFFIYNFCHRFSTKQVEPEKTRLKRSIEWSC